MIKFNKIIIAIVLLLCACTEPQQTEVRKGLYADSLIYRHGDKIDTVISITEYAFYRALVGVDSVISRMQNNTDSLVIALKTATDSLGFRIEELEGDSTKVTLVLTWIANVEPDLWEYRIYWGTASRKYENRVDAGKVTQHILWDLDASKDWYFALTAVDRSGNESGYSAEVVWPQNTFRIYQYPTWPSRRLIRTNAK